MYLVTFLRCIHINGSVIVFYKFAGQRLKTGTLSLSHHSTWHGLVSVTHKHTSRFTDVVLLTAETWIKWWCFYLSILLLKWLFFFLLWTLSQFSFVCMSYINLCMSSYCKCLSVFKLCLVLFAVKEVKGQRLWSLCLCRPMCVLLCGCVDKTRHRVSLPGGLKVHGNNPISLSSAYCSS